MALPFARVYKCALGWFPLGLGLIVQDKPSELSCVRQFKTGQLATRTYCQYSQ